MTSPTEPHDTDAAIAKVTTSKTTPDQSSLPRTDSPNDNLQSPVEPLKKEKVVTMTSSSASESLTKVQEDNTASPSLVKPVTKGPALVLPQHIPNPNEKRWESTSHSTGTRDISLQEGRRPADETLQPPPDHPAQEAGRFRRARSGIFHHAVPPHNTAISQDQPATAASGVRNLIIPSPQLHLPQVRRLSTSSSKYQQKGTSIKSTKSTKSHPDSIPKLKEHEFSMGTTTRDSIDIAVVYICTKEENGQDYSAFVFNGPFEPTGKKPSSRPIASLENKALDSTKRHTPGQGERSDIHSQKPKPEVVLNTAVPPHTPTQASPTRSINWLQDENMLPSVLPTSRVMGFGFDACSLDSDKYFDSAALELITALSEKRKSDPGRPLVFIGHGYGTVIIQSLFSTVKKGHPGWINLRWCTAAIILFAPPFRGSDELVNWTVKSSGLPSSMGEKLYRQLGNRSPYLQKYWKEFRQVAKEPNIFVFAYLSKSAILMEKSIKESKNDQESKTLSLKDVDEHIDRVSYSSAENMRDTAKFSGPNDRRFQSVAKYISRKAQTRLILGAAERGDEDTLAYLINRPFEVNLCNKRQETALHMAAQRENIYFVRTLLSCENILLNSPDIEGMTALHRAVLSNKKNSARIIYELIKAGADRWAGEKYDTVTPVMLADDPQTRPAIKKCFQRPPMVEGPPVRLHRTLKKHTPNGNAIEACRQTDVAATEIFYIPGDEKYPEERPEKHSLVYPSVHELIYSDKPETSVPDIFMSARSRKYQKEKPFCRWYHLPANNMVWVEDLFLTLNIQAYPWPAPYSENGLPHSRRMNPQAATIPILDSSSTDRQALVILMPYISYEEFGRQQAVAQLIDLTLTDHQGLEKFSFGSNTNSETDISTESSEKSSLKEKERSKVGETENTTELPHGEVNTQLPVSEKALTESHGAVTHHTDRNFFERPLLIDDDDQIKDFSSQHDSEPENWEVSESSHQADNSTIGVTQGADIEDSVQLQISAYLMHNPPLHPRRTLDQSYYHMLSDTTDRDKDQVVARWIKRESKRAKTEPVKLRHHLEKPKETPATEHNILMVDQLWLWRMPGLTQSDPDTVITCFPGRTGAYVPPSTDVEETSAEVDDLETTVLRSHNLHPRALIYSTDDLVSRILTVCCRTLDRDQQIETVKFLQMFQSTIGEAEEKETELFQNFRTITEELHCLHEEHRNYQEERGKKLKELLKIHEESNLLKEIKDILDEIKMIRTILADQSGVLSDPQLERELFPKDAKSLLASIDKNFELMETHAKDVEKGLDHLLELKQMQANLWEARSSREGAEETARQGDTILVFTIVTIIFLPLSFMSSFFAIGVAEFPSDDQGNPAWPLGYLCWLLFGISIAISIPMLIIAFNVTWLTKPWFYIRRIWIKKVLIKFSHPLRHIPVISVRSKIYRRIAKWSDSIYAYEKPSTGSLEDKVHESEKLVRAFSWRLKDKEFIDMAERYLNREDGDDDYDPEDNNLGKYFWLNRELSQYVDLLKLRRKLKSWK